MDIQIGAPTNIWMLAIVAVGLIIVGYAVIARRRAALKFATSRLRSQILPPGTRSRHWVSAILIAASLSLLCLAMVDIRWGKTWREVPQKGIEVMFVLDVSRSMLAEDVTPNRLSRAKQQIKDMVDEMAGDRIGLIVFAGDTRQSVPLTSHYEDFQQTLDTVGPHTVRVGGSRLGDALKAAANGFISKTNDHKAIVVFTDGEDQESKPDEVARQLHADHGIRIFTVGLGDMSQGARIPETEDHRGGFVQYDGQQVWSKMNGQILSQIATDTDGAYIPAGTRNVNMAEIYHGYVANVEQTEFETAKINAYVARYQWFAAPALMLLLLEVWISTRATKTQMAIPKAGRTERSAVPADGAIGTNAGNAMRSVRPTTTSYFAAVIIALSAAPVMAQSPVDVRQIATEINAANTLLRDGKVDEALDAYRKVVPGEQQRVELNYNMAVAEYKKGNIEAAEKLFTDVAGTASTMIAADSRYNLGNCQYAKALQLAEQHKPAAIELLREAIGDYRGALRGKPNNPDARANIELAGELIRKLEQEQKKEEQQQKQKDEKQQDQQDKDQQKDDEPKLQDKSQDAESQKSDSEKEESQKGDSQKNSEQKNSDSQDSKSDQQTNEEQMDEEQKNQDEQTDDTSGDRQNKNDQQDSSEQKGQPKSSDGQQKQQKNMQQKSGDQEQPEDEGNPEEQDPKNKSVPTGDLKAASEQEQNKQPDGAVSSADQNAKVGLMTREEALKMLQSVRDRDMLRRMQQQRQERSRRVPVDKDW